jgi:SAM-dependent methyltransferase
VCALYPYQFCDYWELFQFGRRRQRSEADYRRFQRLQANLLLRYLCTWSVDISGRLILDLGSGIGGYAETMAQHGANVISLDMMVPSVRCGENILANAMAIPLAEEQIDFVFCASLIEHVDRPDDLIREIERVLRPGGYCYLSFPPYYSPRGGHEFSPWHYLGEKWALRLSTSRDHVPDWVNSFYEVTDKPESFAAIYHGWGLYRMTICKARRIIAQSNLQLIDMSTRYLPISPIRWPVLNEILTWHAQFLLQKPTVTGAVI